MIVCFCRGLSESDLRAVVAAGAGTVEAVSSACGAATDCGACQIVIEGVVAEAGGTSLAAVAR
jgi:bacterioferritin-associated ferredoxin